MPEDMAKYIRTLFGDEDSWRRFLDANAAIAKQLTTIGKADVYEKAWKVNPLHVLQQLKSQGLDLCIPDAPDPSEPLPKNDDDKDSKPPAAPASWSDLVKGKAVRTNTQPRKGENADAPMAAKTPAKVENREATASSASSSLPSSKKVDSTVRRPGDDASKQDPTSALIGDWQGMDHTKKNKQWHKIFQDQAKRLMCTTWTEGNAQGRTNTLWLVNGDVLWGKGEIYLDASQLTSGKCIWKNPRGNDWVWSLGWT